MQTPVLEEILNFVWVTLDHFFMVVFPMLCKTLPRTSAIALVG